jgi:hypothetical protein
MSYSVRLDDEVEDVIIGWRPPKERISAILRRMDELSEMPSRYLLRIESAEHVLQSDVAYHDPGPPARDCIIALSVRYGVDEETLTIVDCYRLCNDEAR